jgi:DNA-binding MarR family transcriptional regulator
MYLVRRLQLLEREVIENALRPIGLTAGQYTALSMLGRRDGLSSAQLARRFGVAPQSMTDIIKALEDKRLISRHEAESNQRILRIKLTGAGRKCVDICEALVDRAEGQLFAALDRAELTILRQLLGKLVEQHSGDDTDCASDQVTRKTASKG